MKPRLPVALRQSSLAQCHLISSIQTLFRHDERLCPQAARAVAALRRIGESLNIDVIGDPDCYGAIYDEVMLRLRLSTDVREASGCPQGHDLLPYLRGLRESADRAIEQRDALRMSLKGMEELSGCADSGAITRWATDLRDRCLRAEQYTKALRADLENERRERHDADAENIVLRQQIDEATAALDHFVDATLRGEKLTFSGGLTDMVKTYGFGDFVGNRSSTMTHALNALLEWWRQWRAS